MSNYIFESHGRQYTPDGAVSVSDTDRHNREIEARELAQWQTQPDRFIAYVSHPAADVAWREVCADTEHNRPERRSMAGQDLILRSYPATRVTTWLGTFLGAGRITGVYRNNFGARIVSVRVRGTNGAEYVGRYGYDGGNAIRLRKVKARVSSKRMLQEGRY